MNPTPPGILARPAPSARVVVARRRRAIVSLDGENMSVPRGSSHTHAPRVRRVARRSRSTRGGIEAALEQYPLRVARPRHHRQLDRTRGCDQPLRARPAPGWRAATGKPLGPALQHQGWVRRAAFSPDGTRVVTASDDHTARVWETELDNTPCAAWPALAARSPFVLNDSGLVQRASQTGGDPEPVSPDACEKSSGRNPE